MACGFKLEWPRMSFNLAHLNWIWNRILKGDSQGGFSRGILKGDSQESDFWSSKSWESRLGSLGNPGIDKISTKFKLWGSKSHEFGHPKKTRNAITSRMVRFSARELCSEVHLCKKCWYVKWPILAPCHEPRMSLKRTKGRVCHLSVVTFNLAHPVYESVTTNPPSIQMHIWG